MFTNFRKMFFLTIFNSCIMPPFNFNFYFIYFLSFIFTLFSHNRQKRIILCLLLFIFTKNKLTTNAKIIYNFFYTKTSPITFGKTNITFPFSDFTSQKKAIITFSCLAHSVLISVLFSSLKFWILFFSTTIFFTKHFGLTVSDLQLKLIQNSKFLLFCLFFVQFYFSFTLFLVSLHIPNIT